jgi:hypothetical protein
MEDSNVLNYVTLLRVLYSLCIKVGNERKILQQMCIEGSTVISNPSMNILFHMCNLKYMRKNYT